MTRPARPRPSTGPSGLGRRAWWWWGLASLQALWLALAAALQLWPFSSPAPVSKQAAAPPAWAAGLLARGAQDADADADADAAALPAAGLASAPLDAVLAASARASALAAAAGPQPWDLCGLGLVPIPPGSPSSDLAGARLAASTLPMASPLGIQMALEGLPAPIGGQLVANAIERSVAVLRRGIGVRQRAAALLLEGGSTEALVQLALESPDFLVMRWALMRCAGQREGQGCERINPRWLTRLDGQNVVPWLLFAAAEPAAQAEWLPGLQRANRVSHNVGVLSFMLMQVMPADLPAYLLPALDQHAMGIETSLTDLTRFAAYNLCRPQATAHPGPAPTGLAPEAPVCEHLASLMADRSDSIESRADAVRLRELASWPADKLQPYRDQVQQLRADAQRVALPGREAAAAAGSLQPLSCQTVQRYGQWLRDRVRRGEVRAISNAPANRAPPATVR